MAINSWPPHVFRLLIDHTNDWPHHHPVMDDGPHDRLKVWLIEFIDWWDRPHGGLRWLTTCTTGEACRDVLFSGRNFFFVRVSGFYYCPQVYFVIHLVYFVLCTYMWKHIVLLRGVIVSRTYGRHKNLCISPFLPTIFGPINYAPPPVILGTAVYPVTDDSRIMWYSAVYNSPPHG